MTPPYISIVVLNWNGATDTLACLVSLASLTYPNFNVVVVDNGSTDDSLARLRTYAAPYQLTLLETGLNLGYAGGNNVGTRYAITHGADFVLVLNNDTTVALDLLERLASAAQHNPDAGVFSARVLLMDRPTVVAFDGAKWDVANLCFIYPGEGEEEAVLAHGEKETDYACGASLFFRSEVVNRIGLLDERFFLTWEESDWCFRARRAGFGCRMVPSAKIFHTVAASFSGENSPLRIYFSVRNRLLWAEKNLGWASYMRISLREFTRLIPKFSIGEGSATWFKRVFWTVQEYVQALAGRGNRFEYLAVRQGIKDYVLRRFGDCPDLVRTWSNAWAARQRVA
jgi:GT2 family glycosyltransferase